MRRTLLFCFLPSLFLATAAVAQDEDPDREPADLPEAPAVPAAQTDPLVELARHHAKRAVDLRASPRAAAHLVRLHAMLPGITDLQLFTRTYGQLIGRRNTDPQVRALALFLLGRVERARGRLQKEAEFTQGLGFIKRYWLLGSFENEGKAGCDVDHGPESKIDLTEKFPQKGHELSWRRYEEQKPGALDLSGLLRPNKEATAYALTTLVAPEETRATLSVSTSGAHRLFVNGVLVAKDDAYNAYGLDQQRVTVKLRRGENRVLLKVCHDDGKLGFALRHEYAAKDPVATVGTLQALPPLPPGPAPAPVLEPTLTALVEREVKKMPNDGELHFEHAILLNASRAFDESEHKDLVEARAAAKLLPQDVSAQLFAAELEADDHNLRREHLERALAASPDHPLVLSELAELELSRDRPARALVLLEKAIAQRPNFPLAHLNLARTLGGLEESARQQKMVQDLFERFGRNLQIVKEAAADSRRHDRIDEAVGRYRVALALAYDDREARRSLAALLSDTGRTDAAVAELETALKLQPSDNDTRLDLADLLASNGKADEARQTFAAAKAIAPDDPEVHEREGRALLQLGDGEAALLAFERSLRLRPQNPALKEVVRSLRGESATSGVEYALDVRALAKEADGKFKDADAVYLADYTYVRVQASGLSSRFHQMGVLVRTQRGVDAFRGFPITYSPDRQEVRVLKARIYKADGSIVDSYGDSERNINEPWSGMYYDSRTKQLSFQSLAPGDVLELQYRLEDTAQDNLLSDYFGDVDYVQAPFPKVRYQYFADMPAARPLYWNKTRLGALVSQTQVELPGERRLYKFEAKDVQRVIPEPQMPGWAEVVTTLHVSTYKEWNDVSRYWWGLVRDQLVPNEDLKATVQRVLANVDKKDQAAVVRAVYEFVVTNTRYVALEFGIHGYKPYRVDRVLARRFGDCKDKASLIHAMLGVAGVESRLVLLRMRHLGTIGDEPASLAAFNHAIAYVPSMDLWLDGTAEFHGVNELPMSDRVADVLVVEPDGRGIFRSTPEAKPEDNLNELSLDVAVQKGGGATITGKSLVKGQEAPHYRRSYQAAATRNATFEQGWAQVFPGLKVESLSLSDLTKFSEPVKLDYRLAVPRYAEVLPTGLRFYPFGSGRSYVQAFAPLPSRKLDLVLSNPWASLVTVRYALPAGFTVTELPPAFEEQTPFGVAKTACRVEDEKVICEARVDFTTARVKAQDYEAFRAFLGRVDQAFGRKILASATAGQTARR